MPSRKSTKLLWLKEHVAWFSPILAIAVAFVVWRYDAQIAEMPKLRYALIVLFVLAFAAE